MNCLYTYLARAPEIAEDHRNDRRSKSCSSQAVDAQLPSLLALPRARIYARHEEHDEYRGEDVEDLKRKVPY